MAITYNASGSNPLGDGSDTQGGIPPAFTDGTEETNHPSVDFTPSDWVVSVSTPRPAVGEVGYNESKFRTHCHPSHSLPDDPVIFPGQPGASHMHQFFGNFLTDANSTYTSLRTTGGSTCDGGPLNRTGYWHPQMYSVLPSGVHARKIADRYSIYYPSFGGSGKMTRIPRGFRYVGGVSTAWNDTMPADQRAAMEAANAAAGWARYQEMSPQDGFIGWTCVDTGVKAPYLKGPNGEDMLQSCPATSQIEFQIHAPRCWNGKDLHSPDGRSHVHYQVHDNATGQDVCHVGSYELPDFQLTGIYSHNGPSDYLNWYLSSDRMDDDNAAPDPSSRSPCRSVGPHFCNGETIHFDWFGAWDYGDETTEATMLKWQRQCTGVKTYPSTTADGGDCRDGETGPVEKLLSGNVPSPDPTLSLDPVTSFVSRTTLPLTSQYYPVPDGTSGTFTVTHKNGAAV